MTTKYYILPYNSHSHGAIMLADELDGKRLKLTGSTYSHKPENVLINWGNGNCPYPQALNANINGVINKVDFFKRLVGCPYAPKAAFTQAAAANLSYPVVCRNTVEGHDGEGIKIAETAAQLSNCHLYTEYVDKTSEYRVHLGRLPNGDVTIIVRQKKFKSQNFTGDGRIWTGPETKLEILNLIPNAVAKAAKEVFAKFPELTFGAFDIAYNNSEETAYVLEINSAPMMTAGTTSAYADFFRTNWQGQETPATTQETAPMNGSQYQPSTGSQAPATATPVPNALSAFVKAQLAAGHITLAQIEAYTPKPTEEQIIQNYVDEIYG